MAPWGDRSPLGVLLCTVLKVLTGNSHSFYNVGHIVTVKELGTEYISHEVISTRLIGDLPQYKGHESSHLTDFRVGKSYRIIRRDGRYTWLDVPYPVHIVLPKGA